MASKDQEYKELFMAEAAENQEELNRLLTALEKNPSDKAAIDAVFRITHTLKGNALGMGFTEIAELAHVLEDLFGEFRSGTMSLNADIINSIFKAFDILGELVQALQSGATVRYKGIKTKLEVLIKKQSGNSNIEINTENKEEKNPASKPISIAEKTPITKKTHEKAEKKAAIAENLLPEINTLLEVESQVESSKENKESDNKITFSDLVQVPVRKLDNLLNLVGELIIERDRLIAQNATSRSNEYSRLNRISSDLQYSVMDVRLVQVGFLFNKFHRVVRDAAASEKKKVNLKLEGVDTEIDRNILQIISDSLIHIIRNAVGHGIESPEERTSKGKTEEGTITLKASAESEGVLIEINDDGKGINIEKVREKVIKNELLIPELAQQLSDKDILMYIFEPGFSTADQVTTISGRGVGMDVVKKALDSVGGTIDVHTEADKSTSIRLSLPSSMAVKGTLLFQLQDTEYAVPLTYTEAVISIYKKDIHKVGQGLVTRFQSKTISLVFMRDLFFGNQEESDVPLLQQSYGSLHPEQKMDVVVVNYNGKTIGFVVDKLLQQKEIVEKPLAKPVDFVRFIGGVTILGNGNVCLVVHIPAIINYIFSHGFAHGNKNLMFSSN